MELRSVERRGIRTLESLPFHGILRYINFVWWLIITGTSVAFVISAFAAPKKIQCYIARYEFPAVLGRRQDDNYSGL